MKLLGSLVIFGCGTLAVLLYRYILHKKALKEIDELYKKEILNKVWFFNDMELGKCENHFVLNSPCSRKDCPSLKHRVITEHIDNCIESLDICIHLITLRPVTDSIIDAYERGVRVRMIVDYDKAYSKNSTVLLLLERGLDIKVPVSRTCVHSKMAILDGQALMTGSLNWTNQGLVGNWDNLMITSEPEIVAGAVRDFEFLWREENTCHILLI